MRRPPLQIRQALPARTPIDTQTMRTGGGWFHGRIGAYMRSYWRCRNLACVLVTAIDCPATSKLDKFLVPRFPSPLTSDPVLLDCVLDRYCTTAEERRPSMSLSGNDRILRIVNRLSRKAAPLMNGMRICRSTTIAPLSLSKLQRRNILYCSHHLPYPTAFCR